MRRKIASMVALCGAVAAGTVGLLAGPASAHYTDISYDCKNVTVAFTEFATNPPGTGVNSAVVTINDTKYGPFTWTTADHTVTIPYVRYAGQGYVEISSHYVGLDGDEGNGYLLADTDNCGSEPPTTTTPPTTTAPTTTTPPIAVSPDVVVRPTNVVAPTAVVAAPAFTG